MNDIFYIIGKYYGYPLCCIDYFIQHMDENIKSNKLRGLGYIPCDECQSHGEIMLIKTINANRMASKKFPSNIELNVVFDEILNSEYFTIHEKEIIKKASQNLNQLS